MIQTIGDPDKGKIYIRFFDLAPVDGILPLRNIDSTCDSTFQLPYSLPPTISSSFSF